MQAAGLGVGMLRQNGLASLDQMFPSATIARWNASLDPLFAVHRNEARPELDVNALHGAGIFREFFNEQMRCVIRSIMPDATLFHFHCYETASEQNRSHIFGDRLEGWHSDIQRLPGLDLREPHFVSIFVYLTKVGASDGAFEIAPILGDSPTVSGPSSKVLGDAGTTFLWNRAFLHRASPNAGPTRRRLLKVSIQHNYLQNEAIEAGVFSQVLSSMKGEDEFVEYLLGSRHSNPQQGWLLPLVTEGSAKFFPTAANSRIAIPVTERALALARHAARRLLLNRSS